MSKPVESNVGDIIKELVNVCNNILSRGAKRNVKKG